MVGGGAAAAPHEVDSSLCEFGCVGAELCAPHGELGLAIFDVGEAGIGFGHQRYGGQRFKTLDYRQHLYRPRRAVAAEGMHSQALQCYKCGLRGSAVKCAHCGLEGHGCKDEVWAHLLDCYHLCPGFLDIDLCLHGKHIHATVKEALYLPLEHLNSFVEIQFSERLYELAAGADVSCHQHCLSCVVSALAGYRSKPAVHLFHIITAIL